MGECNRTGSREWAGSARADLAANPYLAWELECDSCDGGVANHQSFIGKGLALKGEITGSGSLLMDGAIEGNIHLQGDKVTLGRHSRVAASIDAGEVVVHGEVRGNLRAAELVVICCDASMTGDVTTARILIEDGAFLKGSVDARRHEAGASASVAARPQSKRIRRSEGYRRLEIAACAD